MIQCTSRGENVAHGRCFLNVHLYCYICKKTSLTFIQITLLFFIKKDIVNPQFFFAFPVPPPVSHTLRNAVVVYTHRFRAGLARNLEQSF